MKKLILLFTGLLCAQAQAQTFTSIGTDVQNDHGFGLDAKELFYYTNSAEDTLFVKIETYSPRQGDFGFALAIDTNLVTSDGHLPVQNNISNNMPNTSMNFDVMLFAYQNSFFPGINIEAIEATGGTPASIGFTTDTIDPWNFVMGIPIADIGGDIEVNLVAFTGSFDISPAGAGPLDALPNSTYSEVRKTNIGLQENIAQTINLYPNPTSKYLKTSIGFDKIDILSLNGKRIKTVLSDGSKRIDISDLPKGTYLIKVDNSIPKKLLIR